MAKINKLFFCTYDEDPEFCYGCDHEYGLHQKNDGYSCCSGSVKCCEECIEIIDIKSFNEELAKANKGVHKWNQVGWKKALLARLKGNKK